MKALFVNAGNDSEEAGNANISSFPPLGIISMATMVNDRLGKDVELFLKDGQIDSCEEVCHSIVNISPDVVFISMYCTGIFYALSCAHVAHACGALVVLGNDHAMAHYDTLLNKISDIDIISLEEYGELSSLAICKALLDNKNPYEVSCIAYKKEGKVIVNGFTNQEYLLFRNDPFKYIPLPKRTLLNNYYWEIYLENFRKVKWKYCDKSKATGVTTMNRARGCLNVNHRCAYCGISDLSIQKSTGHSFWDDVRNAKNEINANFFYECFDNFTSSNNYMLDLLKSRPKDLNDFHLCVYSSSNRISSDICDVLKELGVYLVNLGLDAADEMGLRILKGSNTSVADNYKAVNMLTKKELEMHISFVLMGMGNNSATRKSLDKTIDFVKYIVKNTSVTIIDCALFYPDKAAPVGGLLWKPEMFEMLKDSYHLSYIDQELLMTLSNKWNNKVFINSSEITKDFATICGTNYEMLLEYQSMIKEICEENNVSFGYSQAGKIE